MSEEPKHIDQELIVNFLYDHDTPLFDGENGIVSNAHDLQAQPNVPIIGVPTGPGKRKRETRKIIKNCVFEGSFKFEKFHIQDTLVFKNCTFQSSGNSITALFHSLKGHELVFENCNSKSVHINFLNLQDIKITVLGSSFFSVTYTGSNRKSLHVDEINGKQTEIELLTFRRTGRLASTVINNAKINQINFDKRCPETVEINGGDYGTINFPNVSVISHFLVHTSDNNQQTNIGEFRIDDLSLNGSIVLQDASISKLIAHKIKLMPERNFKLQAIKNVKQFSFTESILDNAHFIDLDLTNAIICFDQSYVRSIQFANIQWPDDYQICVSEFIKSESNDTKREIKHLKTNQLSLLRESYRQLKDSYKSTSDMITAMFFHRNELDVYRYYLKLKRTKLGTRTILWLNKNISNYGLNWFKPFVLIIVSSLFFFSLLLTLNYKGLFFTLDCNQMSYNAFAMAIEEFIKFLNPLRTTLDGMTGLMPIIDIISRLWNAFLIYHFIKATRRFAKL